MHEDKNKRTLNKLLELANHKKNQKSRHELKDFLKTLKNLKNKGTGNKPTDDEIEELLVLIKTGTVNVTLKELYDFVNSTGKPHTSDPPLVWRS